MAAEFFKRHQRLVGQRGHEFYQIHIYFSFFNKLQEVEDEGVELIFVSCDRSKADMISYMKVSGAHFHLTQF